MSTMLQYCNYLLFLSIIVDTFKLKDIKPLID